MTENNLPPGLVLYECAVSEEEETELIDFINSNIWNCSMKRRVQHYGSVYQYKFAPPTLSEVPPVPDIFISLLNRLVGEKWPVDKM